MRHLYFENQQLKAQLAATGEPNPLREENAKLKAELKDTVNKLKRAQHGEREYATQLKFRQEEHYNCAKQLDAMYAKYEPGKHRPFSSAVDIKASFLQNL